MNSPPVTILGPFGPSDLIDTMEAEAVEKTYADKCGAAVSLPASQIWQYRCQQTGMRFWRPETLAGDEAFYQHLSEKWPFYYRPWRWEYGPTRDLLKATDRVLEIGSGQGFFLRETEGRVAFAAGLETNRQAIANKTTNWDIQPITIEEADLSQFDVVCSFQVLEHVVDPAIFIRSALNVLRPGGMLALSTPNPQFRPNRLKQDPFDFPPHHMNQFPASSYERIAAHFGIRLEKLLKSPRWGEFALPWQREPLLARMAGAARNLVDKIRGEPGSTLLAVFRKP